MRLRTTLILLVVLLGLGGYLYWVELPQAEQEAKKKTLFEFKPDDVVEVSLTYQDRDIALTKSGDDWRLVNPLDVMADTTTVKNLINAISECEVKKELTEASADLAAYGLDKPFVIVKVKLKDKELPAVAVGKNTPVGFNTYIQRLDDKKLLLANSAFRSGMDKQVNDLRDKTILSVADTDVQKFELRGADTTLQLARKGDGWEIVQPGSLPADASTVRSFLSTLRSMRAVDFPPAVEDLSTYGLDKPRLRITLFVGKDNAEKQILIGGEKADKKTEIYVQTSGTPTIYTVNDWVWRDLNKGPNDFRDKTIVAFERTQLRAVEVRSNDGTSLKLVGSDKDGWRVDGAEGKPAATTINQWIGELHELKGYEIAADQPTSLAEYGLDNPHYTVVLTGEGNAAIGTILVGEHKTEQGTSEYYAMTLGGPTVFKIRDYLATRLKKQSRDFLELPTPTPGGPTLTPAPAAVGEDVNAMGLDGDEGED